MNLNIQAYTSDFVPLAQHFDCGNSYLNQFLRSSDALDSGIGKTFVFLSEDGRDIIGYYNISCGALDEVEYGKRYKIGGSVHIGYFAIDENFQHRFQSRTANGVNLYLGDLLLEECLNRIESLRATQIGVSFVTLASSKAGERLYRHHGFEDLDSDITFSPIHGEDECICLYLPLDY